MYQPILVTPPADMPITVAQAKEHCRVDDGDAAHDAAITAYLEAAVAYLDGWEGVLGRCLVTQSWRQDFDCFARCLRLPLGPVSAVAVSYYDANGDEQTVEASVYSLLADGKGWFVRFNDEFAIPPTRAKLPPVSVTFVAGSAVANVPKQAVQAIKLLLGHWYEHREAVAMGGQPQNLPLGFDAVIAPIRRVSL